MKHSRTATSLVTVLLLFATACSRSDTGATGNTTTTAGRSAGDATSVDQGGFGDLEKVCQPGDASGSTATGVTDSEIHVGTITDKGFTGAQGLNKEMYDSAVAFTAWCNDHGGILGRKLVLDDLDAALTEYEARVTEACAKDFSLVGGGAVFDDDPNGVRVKCGLANIAGYVVSAAARNGALQVQPLPNPLDKINIGRYVAAARDYPDGIKHYAIMSANIPSVTLVRDQLVESATSLGYDVVYKLDYAVQGETGWPNFVADMKSKGVKVLEFVGQPIDLTALNQAMNTAGWHPDVVLLSANFYDSSYAAEAGAVAGKISIQSQLYPFERAKDNKATQDYLDVMKQYNPSGKVALLGAQGFSAWLLFATSATQCGSTLTAECLIQKAEATSTWTAGGLHAPQTPGNTEPSDCWLSLGLDAKGFSVDKVATKPNNGIYNCDPHNVISLTNG